MVISDITGLKSKSSEIIIVICDECKNQFDIKYSNYIRNGNKEGFYTCKTCKTIKTNLEKYGVENPSQLQKIKDKKAETSLKKYGTSSHLSSDIVKEKIKNTNLRKYGVINVFQSNEIKEIIKNSNLDKYGVVNPSQLKEFKEKKKKTTLSNYGVEHNSKSDLIKSKKINTSLDNYGVVNPMQSEIIKNKFIETCLEKYGVENPSQLDFIKEKIISTNLNKYGVKYTFQSNEIKSKIFNTNLVKYGNVSYKKSKSFFNTTIIGNDPQYIEYLSDNTSLFFCEQGHEFELKTDNYFSRKSMNLPICTICNPISDSTSIGENELFEFIRSSYCGDVIQSYRDNLEIDIYLPDLKLGFEFNGLYWHSDKYRDKNYHLNKSKYFQENGIRIIHIWEDDWIFNKDIVKSQILNLLGKSTQIYARNCFIKELKSVSNFLNKNHIQGADRSNIKLGLFYKDELVSVMTFNKIEGRKVMKEKEYNLSRFCSLLNTNVIGAASKLLKYFIINYKPNRIISYADRDWSLGNLYNKIGFELVSETLPDYKYIVNNRRKHKQNFTKSKMNIKDSNLTESKITKQNNIYRIYDCGKLKYEMICVFVKLS